MADPALDVFLHNTLAWDWDGRAFTFEIPEDVFSTFQVDVGTRQLLKQIAQTGKKWDRVLDLGCGYGPLGVALAATGRAGFVRGIDRDALAAAFAHRNAARNGLANAEFLGGVAFDGAGDEPFDLIVTNLPAKAAPAIHHLMLLGASNHLAPGGEVWAVVVRPLGAEIDALLAHPDVEVRQRHETPNYVLYNFAFRGPVASPADPYQRNSLSYDYDGTSFDIDSLDGVSDFDSLWMGTDVIVQLLLRGRESFRRVSVFEPTQGQLPVLLTKLWPEVSSVALASRDLLSLRASEANLRRNGFAGAVTTSHCAHTGELPADTDLVIFQLNGGERTEAQVQRVADAHARFRACPIVVGSQASLGGRLETALNKLRVRSPARLNRKGFRAVRYQ